MSYHLYVSEGFNKLTATGGMEIFFLPHSVPKGPLGLVQGKMLLYMESLFTPFGKLKIKN
jgi:hypothetical protein